MIIRILVLFLCNCSIFLPIYKPQMLKLSIFLLAKKLFQVIRGGDYLLMELISLIPLVILSLTLLSKLVSSWRWRRSHARLPLPPGTMGWPYIGETFQLYSQNPNTFFSSKVKKYGSIFKTHVLGCPCVMISSPEAAKIVLVSKAHLFKPTFPASKERMLGKEAIFFHEGDYHAKLRKLVLRSFTPDSIKDIVSHIESVALSSLQSWEGMKLITTFQQMKTYTIHVALLSIFGKDEVLYRDALKKCYYTVERGYNSLPVNLPGTLFHSAMKARKELAEILSRIISLRRETNTHHSDLLGSFMADDQGLTDDQIADNVIGVIFAARDTTASVLTWILKYLAQNPTVLQAVTEEQEAIMESNGNKGLNWGDTKRMVVTTRVIQETMRVASILSFTFREAVEDVEFQGYLIPKGWKVLPLFRNIHHSPESFTNPETFDPSRFEVAPKPNTFLPFGSGTHSCPGNELAKLEMLVLVHHLTTKYRWSLVGPQNGIQYGPFALPQNGLPIEISSK